MRCHSFNLIPNAYDDNKQNKKQCGYIAHDTLQCQLYKYLTSNCRSRWWLFDDYSIQVFVSWPLPAIIKICFTAIQPRSSLDSSSPTGSISLLCKLLAFACSLCQVPLSFNCSAVSRAFLALSHSFTPSGSPSFPLSAVSAHYLYTLLL